MNENKVPNVCPNCHKKLWITSKSKKCVNCGYSFESMLGPAAHMEHVGYTTSKHLGEIFVMKNYDKYYVGKHEKKMTQ